ncbi:LamG domain-containing protein [Myceligenerans crystallogenes]|uniref:Fibronectin type-III domain-containing protein n=1 Tax=Myceligenerans crystallogenes TaxID=316335 RepID=A0ABP4ZQ64_9MICO
MRVAHAHAPRRYAASVAALSLVLAGLALSVPASRADAAVAADQGTTTSALPPTVSSDPLPTVQINGVVWSQVIVGDTVYVGGRFTSARPAGAPAGTAEVPRANLLRYDLATGELDAAWDPATNGEVKELAVSPDGRTVYAVGPFTEIDGVTRYRAAAFDVATGDLTGFRPSVNGPVYSVATSGADVFLGGAFSTVNGATRARVAAVDAATGATTRAFEAAVGDRSVQAITAAPDGGSVMIGGNFTSVDGSSTPGYGLARLDAATGDLLPLPVNARVRNAGASSAILDLVTDGANVYGTGYHYGGGGTVEGSFAVSWATGELVWLEDCHGDTYSIVPFQGVAYQASHKHYCGNSGGFPETSPRSFKRGTAVTLTVEGTNTADIFGYPDHPGTPRPEFLNWYPDFSVGTFTGQDQGPWHVTAGGDHVVFGGEFLTVNGTPQQGLVRFAVRDLAPNEDGPRLGGSTFPLTATSPGASVVRLAWPGNHDRDDKTLTYTVYRDTSGASPVAVLEHTASFWQVKPFALLDTSVAPGATHRYAVVARDPWGNQAWSPWTEVTVSDGAPLREYARGVLTDGAVNYWRMGGTAAPVANLAGGPVLNAGPALAFGRPGALTADPDTAAAAAGTSTSRAWSAGTSKAAPQTFSVETWFRGTTPGGKLIGYGNRGDATSSGVYDRHLYLDGTGRLVFGVHSATARTVVSPAAVTNGAWHHAVGTLGADGLRLYLDGQLVASEPSITSARAYNGWWRVGGDGLTGWSPSSPATNFKGDLDEIAVYPQALTADQVALHHLVGTTGSGPVDPALGRDTFNRIVVDGWGEATTGGAWTLGGTLSRFDVAGGAGTFAMTGGRTMSAALDDVSAADVDVTVRAWADATPSDTSFLTVLARRAGTEDLGGRVKIYADGHADLHVARNGTPVVGGVVPGLTFRPGEPLLLRVRATGTSPTTVRAKVWAAGTAEPADWQVVHTDTTASLQVPGSVGVRLYTGGTTATTWSFDDFLAVDPANP